jgi:hypothetical protein
MLGPIVAAGFSVLGLHAFQGVRHLTGFGVQGPSNSFRHYRGSAQTHTDLATFLARQDLVHLEPAAAGTAVALGVGHWNLTVIIQTFHNASDWAVAGQGGHVSMFLWNLATGQSLSFHMSMAQGQNGHPELGGALYPYPVLHIFHVLSGRQTPAGALMHMAPTTSGQDVWFYTYPGAIPNADALTMRQRMVHHLNQVASYRNNPVWGIRQLNYFTCLTVVDDILHHAGYSRRISGAGTPWSYSYSFVRWNCSLAAGSRMVHLLPFQQTGVGPARGIRRYVGVGAQVLHWNDVAAHPGQLTEVWDLGAGVGHRVNPPQNLRYTY